MPIIDEIIKQTVVLQLILMEGDVIIIIAQRMDVCIAILLNVPYNNNNIEMNYLQTSKLLEFSNSSFIW